MSRRLTSKEIAESDVVMTIHPDHLALKVRREIEELVRLYGECHYDGTNLVFSVPAYRYDEEIQPALWRAGHEYVREQMPKTYEHICKFVEQGKSCAEILGEVRAKPNLKLDERLLSQVEGAINHLIRTRNLLREGRK